jgi:hypothetical protein
MVLRRGFDPRYPAYRAGALATRRTEDILVDRTGVEPVTLQCHCSVFPTILPAQIRCQRL